MRKKTVPVRHAVRRLPAVLMLAILVFAAAGCASGSDAADAAESADASADTSDTDTDNADASADTAADIGAAADASDTAYTYPVSEEEALEIALEDAQLTEDDVTITISELQVEEDYACWSIEFYADDIKYDYEIDANSGEMLSRTVRDTDEQGS